MEPYRTYTICPPLWIFVKEEVHASVGNGKPYQKEVRYMVIQRHLLGLPRTDHSIRELQQNYSYSSDRTVQRWIARYEEHNHVLPFRRTGNRRATRELRGLDLLNLALIRSVLPKSRLYEVKAFIYSANPTN